MLFLPSIVGHYWYTTHTTYTHLYPLYLLYLLYVVVAWLASIPRALSISFSRLPIMGEFIFGYNSFSRPKLIFVCSIFVFGKAVWPRILVLHGSTALKMHLSPFGPLKHYHRKYFESTAKAKPWGSVLKKKPWGSVLEKKPWGSVLKKKPWGSVLKKKAFGVAGWNFLRLVVERCSLSPNPCWVLWI